MTASASLFICVAFSRSPSMRALRAAMMPPTRGRPSFAITRYKPMKVIASQTSCGAKSGRTSCGIASALEHEEDQERDRETKEPGRFGEGEAQEREWRYLRGGIARQRIDERREDGADADTGAGERDAGKTGTDHFGSSKFHIYSPGLRERN